MSHASVTSQSVPTNPSVSTNTSENTAEPDLDNDEIAWLDRTESDELTKCLDTCVDRWRNAGPEARKKMFTLFAIAGIFLAVCRHGHVLVICDMIRSGELYVSFLTVALF
jgi:Kyakuja-Dileera-Zisupton transposase